MENLKELLLEMGYSNISDSGREYRMKPIYRASSSDTVLSVRKDTGFYSKYMWTEDSDSPYAWFDTDKNEWYLQHVGTGIREYL